MAWVSIQVTLGAGATRVHVPADSTSQIPCRQIVFQNNAAAVMRIGDASVSATKGISLTAAGAAGSLFTVGPSVAYASYLSDFWVFGTGTQILDVLYNT